MGKKRKCRMTDEERQIHEEAVKLRKMTDQQLIDVVQAQYRIGFNDGMKYNKDNFMKAIAEIKGIGAVTIAKIVKAVEGCQ